jgi:hypothetical protein
MPQPGTNLKEATDIDENALRGPPQVPWPWDVGSNIGVHNLLRCYADQGAVTLVCFAEGPTEAQSVRQVGEYCHRAPWFPLRAGAPGTVPRASRLGAFCRVMHPLPWSMRRFSSAELGRQVGALLARAEFDVLHVPRLFRTRSVAQVCGSAPRRVFPTLALDIDDLESGKTSRRSSPEPWSSARNLSPPPRVPDALCLRGTWPPSIRPRLGLLRGGSGPAAEGPAVAEVRGLAQRRRDRRRSHACGKAGRRLHSDLYSVR